MIVRCFYCNEEFDSKLGWQRCYGWQKKAGGSGSRRGGSDVALRQPYLPEQFACEPCVDGMKHGRSPHQGGFDLG